MNQLKQVAKTLLAGLEQQLHAARIFSSLAQEGERADDHQSHKLLQLRLHKDFNRHGQHLSDLARAPKLRTEIEKEMRFTPHQAAILERVLALETSSVVSKQRHIISIVQQPMRSTPASAVAVQTPKSS